MKITIRDTNPAFAAAWTFDLPGVVVEHGSILDVICDAFVSPANSFGFMDGGVDYAYSAYMGWHVQAAVQREIAKMPFGELLVGQALVIPTGYDRAPHLICAPTMRIPRRITDPADVMLATRAAVSAALERGLEHIAFPGMGTGCGGLPFDIASKAMRAGIETALAPLPPPQTWREAQERHSLLIG